MQLITGKLREVYDISHIAALCPVTYCKITVSLMQGPGAINHGENELICRHKMGALLPAVARLWPVCGPVFSATTTAQNR